MGVDIRTGGKEGERVFAPEDGYIYRIKTSYSGYGKGLYLQGNSGRLYVFGHLSTYNWDIGTYLQKNQIASKRYFQDLYPDKNEFPVKKGDFLARTGQTGAGAPHLHFEIRDRDGYPINPMKFPIGFKDNSAPAFEALWLTYLDDNSLFEDGRREKLLIPVKTGKGKTYIINDTIAVTGRIAIKAAISDYLAAGSFNVGPANVKLFIDDTLYHEVDYSRISYDEDPYSILDKDSDPAKAESFRRVYNLYRKSDSRFSGYSSDFDKEGTFSAEISGLHGVRIEATDPFGNSSSLTFAFYYIHDDYILSPFNKADFSDSLIHFQFADIAENQPFDSVIVYHPGTDSLPVRVFPTVEYTKSGLDLRGNFSQWTRYQLRFYSGSIARPPYEFSTAPITPGGLAVVASHQFLVIDGGALVTAEVVEPGINWLMAEINTDVESETLFYRKTGEKRFTLYFKPPGGCSHINSIITRGPVGYRPDTLMADMHVITAGRSSTVELREGLELDFDSGTLFGDAILSIRDTTMPEPRSGRFISGPFVLSPQPYDFANWAELKSDISGSEFPLKTGLYVFDEKKGWLWAGGDVDEKTGILRSKLGGTGVIAVITDTIAPAIANLNIPDRGSVKISHPEITFSLSDELSDIEDDRNFDVTIDDTWLSPEYDPERKTFRSKTYWRLTPGSHTLRITITDRCGNMTSETREFRVRAKPGP